MSPTFEPLQPVFKLSALSLALISAPAAASDVFLPTVEVSGQRSSPSYATENTGEYTAAAMSSATGLSLAAHETPQAVTVMTHQRIRDQSLTDMTAVLQQTPGIVTRESDNGGRTAFYSRGFPIDKYRIDGQDLKYNDQYSAGESTPDMVVYDRAEVVRGAAALTAGAGDPSASVNLIRKHADSKTRKTVLEGRFGRWRNYGAYLDHSQPLTAEGTVRARIIAGRTGGESSVNEEARKTDTLYGIVDFDLGGRTTAYLGAHYRNRKQDRVMWGGLPPLFSDGSPTDWPRSQNSAADWSRRDSQTISYFTGLKHRFSQDWTLETKAMHSRSTSDDRLFYISGLPDKATATEYGVSPGRFGADNRQSDVSVQLVGRFGLFGRKHDLAVGAQYSLNHIKDYQHSLDWDAYTGAFPYPSIYAWDGRIPQPQWLEKNTNDDWKETEAGAYAATRLNLTDRLKAVAGLRLSRWSRKGTNRWSGAAAYSSGNVWSPYAGVLFDLNDNHTVYASYTDIFKAQNYMDANGKVLEPVTGRNYEAGLKSRYFGDRLGSQISVFRIEQDHVAQQDGDRKVNGRADTQAYVAVDGVVSQGYEIEISGRPLPAWNIALGFSAVKAKAADGTRVDSNLPDRTLKLFTTYDAGDRLTLGGGLNWQSGSYFTVANAGNAKVSQGSFATASLMGRYRFSKKLEAQFNIDNLFDKKYYSQFGFYNQVNYGMPRNIRASVRYEF